MRRTPKGVRHFITCSKIPHSAWARRLHITQANFHLLLHGVERFQKGPAMQRLIVLLDALDKSEWKWIQDGPRHLDRSWTWEGEPHELMPPKPRLRVNLLAGSMEWAP